MKLKINGLLFEIVLSFTSPGTVALWQAEAYRFGEHVETISGVEDRVPEIVASGTTPDNALQAIAIELSEVY